MIPMHRGEPAIVARLLLPTPIQTQLLRALLLAGEDGQLAWIRWQALTGDPPSYFAADRLGHKRLLPLLYRARQRHGFRPGSDFTTWLRSAYAREKLRSNVYLQGTRQALTALSDATVPTIALKGAALAEQVYGDWALRHCHDLDLLVDTQALARAIGALQGASFSVVPAPSGSSTTTLRDSSGLLVLLHTLLLDHPLYRLPFDGVWERSRQIEIAGVGVRSLSPADSLLHICTHASCTPARATLRWACDAWHVLARTPDLDWDSLERCAVDGHLGVPMAVCLGYLRTSLDAAVPSRVLTRLRYHPRLRRGEAYEAVLYGVALGARAGVCHALGRDIDWRSRAALLKWGLLPSPRYVSTLGRTSPRRVLPARYLYRLLGAACPDV